MKNALKLLLPPEIFEYLQRVMRGLNHLRNQRRSPREIFTEVYQNHRWGGEIEDYYSGSGSDEVLARPHAEAVRRFIRENQVRSIVDLGCGDFRVGSRVKVDGVTYLGVDVVPTLIARDQEKYARDEVSFACLDIITDDLPDADLCLIRQVFQHLSNDQICGILPKLHQYRYVLITEHYPAPDIKNIIPNIDKAAGADTRILDCSAVFLGLPPFNLEPKLLLLDVEVPNWLVMPGERLKTFVFGYPRPHSPKLSSI